MHVVSKDTLCPSLVKGYYNPTHDFVMVSGYTLSVGFKSMSEEVDIFIGSFN